MEINDSITHIILGSLPESGMKEIRQLAMWGAVYVLQPAWLEDCTRQKRELPTDLYLVPQSLLLQGSSPYEEKAGPHVFLIGHMETTSCLVYFHSAQHMQQSSDFFVI